MALALAAYTTLEASVGQSIAAGWPVLARALMTNVRQAVSQGRFGDAYDACAHLTLADLVQRQRRRLEELGVAAVLLGASRLTSLQLTALMSGDRALPKVIGSALDQLTLMLEDGAAEQIRTAAGRIVALAEEERHRAELAPAALLKADLDLADALNAAVLGNGRALIDVGANLTTSRLVSYGFLDQARVMLVERYQVTEILDGRHCPVCEYMHGQTFEVAQEAARVEQVLQILDPKELRSAAPWPKQDQASLDQLRAMTPGMLQGAGYGSPPYHPLCRGQLVPEGSVSQLSATQASLVTPTGPTADPLLAQMVVPQDDLLALVVNHLLATKPPGMLDLLHRATHGDLAAVRTELGL